VIPLKKWKVIVNYFFEGKEKQSIVLNISTKNSEDIYEKVDEKIKRQIGNVKYVVTNIYEC
jgi:hypothetical protein